jgi:mRNA interferase RelE/StbE
MDWKIRFEEKAKKRLGKLGPEIQLQIISYLFQRVAVEDDPRLLGKGLTGRLRGFWRYRVGDYQVICEIRNKELLILDIQVGHRSEVYK